MEYPLKKLIVFDYDGTIVKAFTDDLLPNVAQWFSRNRNNYIFATINNFGGVGLRTWMEADGWGAPDQLPTETETHERVYNTLLKLGLSVRDGDIRNYMSFAYQARNGNWSPRPAGKQQAIEWQPESRKPSPGLLLQAMKDAGVTPAETLMVGDDWKGEDSLCASRAGVKFVLAREFFDPSPKNDFEDKEI